MQTYIPWHATTTTRVSGPLGRVLGANNTSIQAKKPWRDNYALCYVLFTRDVTKLKQNRATFGDVFSKPTTCRTLILRLVLHFCAVSYGWPLKWYLVIVKLVSDATAQY
jgi:hypothetical protein